MLTMKKIVFLLSAVYYVFGLNAQPASSGNQKDFCIEKIINSQWTFNYFPDETMDKGYELAGFNDSKWPAISLPHTWFTYETTGDLHPFSATAEHSDNLYWFSGWGWYRKHFSINPDYSDREVFVKIMDVRKSCKVWLNGKLMGEYKGNEGPVILNITRYLRQGMDNVLAIAVSNPQGIESLKLPVGSENNELFGGLTGDMILILKNKLYFPREGSATHEPCMVITTPSVSNKAGIARVQTWVRNEHPQKKSCTLQTSIIDNSNKIIQVIKSEAVINPGQEFRFDQTFKSIKKPHLWSDKVPYCYKVNTEVLDGEKVTDMFTSRDGLKFALPSEKIITKTETENTERTRKVFVYNLLSNNSTVTRDNNAGEPARIVVTCPDQNIIADRNSVITITADVVDSNGNNVTNLNKSIKWNISGPALVVGPAYHIIGRTKADETEELWDNELPVSNVIRSTGKPGKILISVSSTGLASGSLEIIAGEVRTDNSVIIEPVLQSEERKEVVRLKLKSSRLDEVPKEILMAKDDFTPGPSDKQGQAAMISAFMLRNNPSVNPGSIEFKALVDLFSSHLYNNGKLSADDYNFTVDHYNNYRLVSGYIDATKLPPLFKETLKKYYVNFIITEGNEINAGDEMNWLNWIPSGGTVVVPVDRNPGTYPKGTMTTSLTRLPDLIALVYPVFPSFSQEAKERALIFIYKMNPYVHRIVAGSDIVYSAEKEHPVLIPLLKFIAE